LIYGELSPYVFPSWMEGWRSTSTSYLGVKIRAPGWPKLSPYYGCQPAEDQFWWGFGVWFFRLCSLDLHLPMFYLWDVAEVDDFEDCLLLPCCGRRRNGSNTWEPMPEMRGSPVIVVGFGQEVGLMVRWCLMNSKAVFGGTEVDKINPKIDALCLLHHITFHPYVWTSITTSHLVLLFGMGWKHPEEAKSFGESIGRLSVCIDDRREHSLRPRFRESAYTIYRNSYKYK